MNEFGSDFHFIKQTGSGDCSLPKCYPSAVYYADGRQPLVHLFRTQGWERLWIPEFFCYDVVSSLKRAGIDVQFYRDYPEFQEDAESIDTIRRQGRFRSGDALLRVNYYGMRSYRSTEKLPVAAIIEDHTHDFLGKWAKTSQADWCIASLRKTLPIPEGGMLWSPIGLSLPNPPDASEENERIAAVRWDAMRAKTRYLNGEHVEKKAFRAGLVNTEEYFDRADVCTMDKATREYLASFDVSAWYRKKQENWRLLSNIEENGVRVVFPEDKDCNPFSLVLVFDSGEERDRVRKALIENQVYPAILWNVPDSTGSESRCFSKRMISIHCDGRYNAAEIMQMKSIIESIL